MQTKGDLEAVFLFSFLLCSLLASFKIRSFRSSLATSSALFRTQRSLTQPTESILKMSPPTKRMKLTRRTAVIDDLPPEMVCELFKYLPPKDLAVCSMVNKRWHSIYTAFKLHSLVVIGHPDYDINQWNYPVRRIEETERCSSAMFRRLVEKPLLSNLRRLALPAPSSEFDLNELNRFKRLVHLEICIEDSDEVKVHLNLPQLKVLVFYNLYDNRALSIDCPQLSTLLYNGERDEKLLEVKHPETITMLETNLLGPQLATFKNVECLVTDRFELIKVTLLSLPRLRELRYIRDIKGLVEEEFDNGVGTIDRVKQTLSEFVDEAKKLRGRDFQFSFSGFQLIKVDVEQIDFGLEVYDDESDWGYNEYVYMENYHLIEPGALQFIFRVNYSCLVFYATGEFPRCFFQKFTGIEHVSTSAKVQDVDHFLWFLKSLRSLKGLELGRTGLGQEFYDQLPESVPSLRSLELRDGHCVNQLQLNFDFISDLKHLSDLRIYSPLSLSCATSLLRWLGRLENILYFCVRSGSLQIRKERDSTVWKAQEKDYYQLLFETENPDEMVNFFETFKETPELEPASD